MRPAKTLRFVLPCLLLGLTASVPHPGSGGWGVITVEELPDHLVAGTTVEVTYTFRQHGLTLRDGLEGWVEASAGAQTLRVTARPGESEGEYRAELTVPERGAWTLTVGSTVVPGLVKPTTEASLLPVQAIAEGEEPPVITEAERGRRLFVAKGCVTCHAHQRAGVNRSIGVALDLTTRHFDADYLAMYLADPSIRAASSGTFRMPDLGLDDVEIARLTAFINADAVAQGGAPR